MRLSMAISFAFAAALGACSTPNLNHCANLQGDATCAARGGGTPFCSKCTADNNGCVADPVEALCDGGSTSVADTSTTTPTTSATTTTGSTSTTTSEPASSSSTMTTGTADPSTSTTTGDDTTTTDESTGPGTGTSTDSTTDATTTTTTDTTTTTTDTTTGTSDETTIDVVMCGDNTQEDPELCDGSDLNGLNCVLKNPQKYSGGTLLCSGNCQSYNETMCCLAQDQPCTPNQGQKCCPGLKCTLLLGLGKCKPV
jgi:hypothetical protein